MSFTGTAVSRKNNIPVFPNMIASCKIPKKPNVQLS